MIVRHTIKKLSSVRVNIDDDQDQENIKRRLCSLATTTISAPETVGFSFKKNACTQTKSDLTVVRKRLVMLISKLVC